jgi:hypothetical protein
MGIEANAGLAILERNASRFDACVTGQQGLKSSRASGASHPFDLEDKGRHHSLRADWFRPGA